MVLYAVVELELLKVEVVVRLVQFACLDLVVAEDNCVASSFEADLVTVKRLILAAPTFCVILRVFNRRDHQLTQFWYLGSNGSCHEWH